MMKDDSKRKTFLDPAVSTLLSDGQRRRKAARRPASHRKKTRRDDQRVRFTFDLYPNLIANLQTTARQEGISVSALASFLLTRAIRDYKAGAVDLDPHKRNSRSPRFESVLEFQTLPPPQE